MLTLLFGIPAVGALVVAVWPNLDSGQVKAAALTFAIITFAFTVYLLSGFNPSYHGFQFQQNVQWVPSVLYSYGLHIGIQYHVGVDGVSIWLLVLNAGLTVIGIAATPKGTKRIRAFLALMLLMEAGMAGVFIALNLILFYVFWEAMLIPAYFLLWQFGEPGSTRAALKFVLFTLAGSLIMLFGIIMLPILSGMPTFEITRLAHAHFSDTAQFLLFFLFLLALAIKIPIFPTYSWLPDAYAAAPYPMLVTFAGVMGKAGAYAMIRILLTLFPHPIANINGFYINWDQIVPVLAVISIIYGGFLALAQEDAKKLVSYSSISHMGFIVLGIFSLNAIGIQGAILQMINHGVIIAALFLVLYFVNEKTGTMDRIRLGGLAKKTPILTALFSISALAALGLPGLNGFVGEFMILFGTFRTFPITAAIATIGLILSPLYMLRLYQGISHGEQTPSTATATDIGAKELSFMVPLIVVMLAIGLFPQGVLAHMPLPRVENSKGTYFSPHYIKAQSHTTYVDNTIYRVCLRGATKS